MIANFFGGFSIFTLMEYVIHRFIFHMPIRQIIIWKSMHFLSHGVHHKVPFDHSRLTFPAIPGIFVIGVIYILVKIIFSNNFFIPNMIFVGIVSGYLCYDMMHYYFHQGKPKNAIFYHLKRYHLHHHFISNKIGFGVTSPLWDWILHTQISLKSLKYKIVW